MTTMEYCIPGPLRRLSKFGTTQYFKPARVGDGICVMVGMEVVSCTCVEIGNAVALAVAVADFGILHATSKTISMLEMKRFFIITRTLDRIKMFLVR